MKKLTALILAVLLLMATLFACAKPSTDTPSTSGSTNDTTSGGEETELSDDLPADLNFDGYKFTIYTYGEGNLGLYAHYYAPDPEDATTVSAAALRRNQNVEDRLKCEIVCNEAPDRQTVPVIIESMADDYFCDVAEIFVTNSVAELLTSGYLSDYTKMDYINLEKPYYSQVFNDVMNIGGKQYLMSGSLVNAGNMPLFTYFNKQMMVDLNLELPYEIALKGGWTFDKFTEYCKNVYSDIDGVAGATDGDRYAVADLSQSYAYMFSGFDINTVKVDENGEMSPNIIDDKIVTAIETLHDFYWNNENVYHGDGFTSFKQGKALFNTYLSSISQLRAIDSFDFGILPLPKYDENQKSYATYDPLSYNITPINLTNPEATGAILEALNFESYKYVVPAYVDDYIEQKILRDDQSIEIFRMTSTNHFVELTRYLPFTTTTRVYTHVKNMLEADTPSVASWAAENSETINREFETFFGYLSE